MDLSELRAAVFSELGESSGDPAYWTAADVNTAINAGYSEISDITEWNETSRTVTIAPPVRYTALFTATAAGVVTSAQILDVVKVYDPARRIWLTPTTISELDSNVDWEMARGAPGRYILRGAFWLGVFPLPNDSTDLTVYTREIPYGSDFDTVALVADGDTPGFPADFHNTLVFYAVYDLLCQDGEYLKGQQYYADFLAGAAALKKWISNRASYPMTRVVGAGGLWPY